MYSPTYAPPPPEFTLHLKPVLDKDGTLFTLKRDKRYRLKVYRLKLKVHNGWVEGDFVVDGITARYGDKDERHVKL